VRDPSDRKGAAVRKLVVDMFMTLDGVMQAPGGPEEDPTGGFAHPGWSAKRYERAGDIDCGSFALDEPTDAELERREALTREEAR
jgi:hypothetical protein